MASLLLSTLGILLRILIVSSFYPPHYIGGAELVCKDVVEGLKARGHEVKVLTSTYGLAGLVCGDGGIYRQLENHLHWKSHGLVKDIVRFFKKEATNRNALSSLFRIYKPDVVYVWNLYHVSISLGFMAKNSGFATSYFIHDDWLTSWERHFWASLCYPQSLNGVHRFVRKLLTHFLGRVSLLIFSKALRLSQIQFTTPYLKNKTLQAGKPVKEAEVIRLGVDIQRFPYRKTAGCPKRFLYVGQIVRHKGVHTAIEAVRIIIEQYGYKEAQLTVVGGSVDRDYETYTRHLVPELGLQNNVRFTGFISRDELPSIYREHDILIFPSLWEEPLGLVLLEAMSSGLAIVATGTGGSIEFLEPEKNALVFQKEQPQACARQILRLVHDSELFEKIRRNGRRTVEERFCLEKTIDQVESSLKRIVNGRDR